MTLFTHFNKWSSRDLLEEVLSIADLKDKKHNFLKLWGGKDPSGMNQMQI
jgi:hypothetical protein